MHCHTLKCCPPNLLSTVPKSLENVYESLNVHSDRAHPEELGIEDGCWIFKSPSN